MYLLPQETVRGRIENALGVLDLAHETSTATLEYCMAKKKLAGGGSPPNPDCFSWMTSSDGVDAGRPRSFAICWPGLSPGVDGLLDSHVLEIVERLCTHVGIIVKGSLVEQNSLDAIRQGSSLEDRFLEKAGAEAQPAGVLRWLEEGTA